MADILLDAHGSWDPASKPAYALVPQDSRLLYYSENLKLFLDSNKAREALLTAEPNQVVEGFKWAQNYTVSAVATDDYITPAGMERRTVAGRMLLCTSDKCGESGWHDAAVCAGLFADPEYQNADIYFVACRYVKLAQAGTPEYYAETGVNQRQDGVGYDGSAEVGYELANSGADMWISQVIALLDAGEDPKDWLAEHTSELSQEQREMVGRRIEERLPGYIAAHPELTP
ncbi:MAG: hypothetical protein QOG01_2674 [Pseudonocardiales bacterium]|jgi:hypothetical protein|nr:hypothetical protein [Pseudonocardiales bacterium]